MKKYLTFGLLLLSINLFAANHIISAGTSGNVLISGEGRKDTIVDLNLGYLYAFSSSFQIGVRTETAYIHRNSNYYYGDNRDLSTWYSFIAPSFIYSIPWGEKGDFRNSIYIEFSPGIILTDSVNSNAKKFNVDSTSLMGNFEIGNRFSLNDYISYTPSLGVYMYEARISNGMVIDPYLTFLKFDLFF